MRDLVLDVRYALRTLLNQRAFSLAAVLTLALGIGITTAIFGIVYGILLRPLSFPSANRLFTVCERFPGARADWCSISPPNVEDLATRSRAIEAIGIGRDWPYHLATKEGAESIQGGLATPGLFHALAVRPRLGRLIEQSDLIGRESTVAVLSYQMWQLRFGGATDVVGRVVSLDGKPVTIVGVLPREFQLPKFEDVQLWRPVHFDPRDESQRDWRGFVAYGRLAPGVPLSVFRSELAGIAASIGREHFPTTAGWGLAAMSLQDLVVGGVRSILLLFLGAVVVVLLIGCANVANLLLARAIVRRRETALRAALGASRGRIARHLLVESLVLAVVSAGIGVAFALWATDAFKAMAPASLPRLGDVRVDERVLGFALALSVGTTLIFGLGPALRSTRADVAQALREGGRTASRGGRRVGAIIVVGELALASMLISGAGLLTRSFGALTSWSPGFERQHLLIFSLFAATEKYPQAQVPALWDRVESALRSTPGVTAAGSASAGPLFGGREPDEVRLEGRITPAGATVRWFDVSPGFFATLGVPLARGRDLDTRDVDGAPFAALVNETLARRYWPGEDPLGRRITLLEHKITFTVVGVVRDIAPVEPGKVAEPQMYWSNRQLPRPFSYFVVRTSLPPASIAKAIRERLRTLDRDLVPGSMQTMDEMMERTLRTPRFDMLLLVFFGATALILAAIGTYGLLAYLVSQRTRELGIRLALGAQRRHILAAVLREGLRLAGTGVLVGVVGSVAMSRAMASVAVGVSALDPLTLAASALVLALVSVAACAAPARRASRVDPALTMSAE